MKTRSFKNSFKVPILFAIVFLASSNSWILAAVPLSDQQLENLYGGGERQYLDYFCRSADGGCPPETPCQGSNGNCVFCVPKGNEACDSRWSGVEDLTCNEIPSACQQQSINLGLEHGPQGFCNIGECTSFPMQSQESYPECSSMQYINCVD